MFTCGNRKTRLEKQLCYFFSFGCIIKIVSCTIKFLNGLQAGGDPDNKSSGGRLPLHEACIGGHPKVVDVLGMTKNL